MMNHPPSQPPMQKRYEIIADVLRLNIMLGRLPRGFVLIEGPIAELMQSSRAPVQAALRILEGENLIHRFAGRGFLVGPPGSGLEPLRLNIRALNLQISGEIGEALQSRGTWELVYDRVEEEVASCLIFGEFRIIEAELGEYLGVSRTVVRDVLSRLHERGLIRKNQSSHWIAGPLTAQSVREKLAVRAILEPAALRMAGSHIDYSAVERLGTRLAEGEEIEGEFLEDALMTHCIARAPNREIVGLIRHNQLLLTAANRALTRLGLPRDRVEHSEYRTLFDLISRHLVHSAAEYLEGHIKVMAEKSLARLKIVAIIDQSSAVAPYLTHK
jgi:DNA-binding GntR family transcriptional regulator